MRGAAFPHAQTRGEAPSPGAQERADLSPQAGRGKAARQQLKFSAYGDKPGHDESEALQVGIAPQLHDPPTHDAFAFNVPASNPAALAQEMGIKPLAPKWFTAALRVA